MTNRLFLVATIFLLASFYLYTGSEENLSPLAALSILPGANSISEAQALEEIALKDSRVRHWSLLETAAVYQRQGELKRARDLYARIPKESAAWPDAALGLARSGSKTDLSSLLALEALAREARRQDLLPEIRLFKGELAKRQGNGQLALSLFRKVCTDYPNHQVFDQAFKELSLLKIRQSNGELPISSRIESINLLIKAGKNELALTQVLEAESLVSPKSPARYELLNQKAQIFLRLDRNSEAKKALLLLMASGKKGVADLAMLKAANLAWNHNDYQLALKQLEQRERKFPESKLANKAGYTEGRILEEMKLFVEAKEQYLKVIARFEKKYGKKAKHSLKQDQLYYLKSLRRLAWLYLQNDRTKKASKIFAKLEIAGRSTGDLAMIQHGLYWKHKADGLDIPKNLIPFNIDSNNYYYFLTSDTSAKNFFTRNKAEANCFSELESKLEERLELLHSAELWDFARHEINWHLGRQLPSPKVSWGNSKRRLAQTMAKTYSEYGSAGAGIRLTRNILAKYRKNNSCRSSLLSLTFPKPYSKYYTSAAQRHNIPPALLYGLSRTESLFQTDAVSPVGARGLMQLMLKTAKMEGLSPKEDIFSPEVNIRLGSKHLARLLKKYNGQEIYAIAAYNAGEEAVDHWIRRYPKLEPAEWAELIAFPETYKYVQKVLAAKQVYTPHE